MPSEKAKDWRLIKDPKRGTYCYLIGIDRWAIELKECEFNSLNKLLNKLYQQFIQMHSELMDEELVSLEIEDLSWYAELEGDKTNWSLRIIHETSEDIRSFEMYWPIPIAKDLFFEMRKMWESMH